MGAGHSEGKEGKAVKLGWLEVWGVENEKAFVDGAGATLTRQICTS